MSGRSKADQVTRAADRDRVAHVAVAHDAKRLAEHIRHHAFEILAEWQERVRALPKAQKLDQPTLIDHVPDLLERIAEMVEALGQGRQPELPTQTAERHALERLDDGFDLTEVVFEFGVLRECLVRRWEADTVKPEVPGALLVLHQAIDHAIAASVERYTKARERTLQALDRISAAALESKNLNELLDRLLRVLVETVAAVDTAVILLREGDMLRVRAAQGLEEHIARGLEVRIGEGLAGAVAAERRPMLLQATSIDSFVKSGTTASKGVRTLYAIPLAVGDDLIGVAHIGSSTAFDFSDQDKHLLTSLGKRVTSALHQHVLREQLHETEERFRVLVESVEDYAIYLVDPDGRVATWNIGAEKIKGYKPEEVIGKRIDIFYPAEDVANNKPQTLLARALQHGRTEDEGWRVRKDGSQFWANVVITALRNQNGGVVGFAKVTRDLTSRKRTEDERSQLLQQLHLERARLNAVIEYLPAGVVIAEAPSGRLLQGNKRNTEIWRRPFLPSAGVQDYGEWVGFDPVTGQQLQPHEWALARAIVDGEEVLNQEVEILRGDGTRTVINNNAAPIRDEGGRQIGAVSVFYDIAAQKEQERERARLLDELSRAEQVHRFLSEASKQLSESIDYETTLASITRLAVPTIADWCVADLIEDGVIRRVSVAHIVPAKVELAAELVRRYPPDPNAQHGVAAVVRTGQPELIPDIPDSLLQSAARDPDHLRILRELGLRSYIAAPMIVRGNVVGALLIVSAESGRRYTEHDVVLAEELARRAAVAIENARLHKETQDAVRSREQVLAVVSHDLRNPLGAIELGANLLAQRVLTRHPDDRTRKHIDTVQRAASRMERLITDLLDMASIQSGRLAIDLQRVNFVDVLSEGLDLMEPIARDEGVAFRRDVPGSPVFVNCDRERIVQVLSNLVGNAIKFSASGGSVTVRAHVKESNVVVTVADRGPGIPADEIRNIFDPYWTVTRHGKKGTGLGLYIAKGIVEAHRGRIWVESKVGEGATFCFMLPCGVSPRA